MSLSYSLLTQFVDNVGKCNINILHFNEYTCRKQFQIKPKSHLMKKLPHLTAYQPDISSSSKTYLYEYFDDDDFYLVQGLSK